MNLEIDWSLRFLYPALARTCFLPPGHEWISRPIRSQSEKGPERPLVHQITECDGRDRFLPFLNPTRRPRRYLARLLKTRVLRKLRLHQHGPRADPRQHIGKGSSQHVF